MYTVGRTIPIYSLNSQLNILFKKFVPIAAPYVPEQVQPSFVAYNSESNGIEEVNDDEGGKVVIISSNRFNIGFI